MSPWILEFVILLNINSVYFYLSIRILLLKELRSFEEVKEGDFIRKSFKDGFRSLAFQLQWVYPDEWLLEALYIHVDQNNSIY